MRVNTMPKRKDINNDLGEAIDAAYQSGKGFITKLFGVILQRERLFTSGKHLHNVNLPGIHLRLYRPQLAGKMLEFMTEQLDQTSMVCLDGLLEKASSL